MHARIRTILEMIRFSHTLFALPFAVLAASMATRVDWQQGRAWRWLDWVGILLCMVLARSAAMAFNRLVDRELDAANPRTAVRHLPRGLLAPAAVAWFTVVCAAGFVAATFLFVLSNDNWWPPRLSVPVLLFVCGYSWTKRFTALSHFWLGASLMLAPVAAWLAIRGELAWPPVILGAAVLFWVAGFDLIYACQDVEFDLRAGLRSVPARWGVRRSLWLAAACHLVTVALLGSLPLMFELGWIYRAGVLGIAVLLVVEHTLVRPDDLTRLNIAFFNLNIAVSLGLLVVGLLDMAV